MNVVVELRPELQERIDRAFATAATAANDALAALRLTWPTDETGRIRDACGLAFVYVQASRKLKRALTSSGRVGPARGLRLIVRVDYDDRLEQSITAREQMAKAAAEVLNRHLGDQGSFSVESRMD